MSEPIRRMLVAYDISQDRRRDRVAVLLQEYGERVQYSVFLVDGRPASFVRLRHELRLLIVPETDSVMFVDLGRRDHARTEVVSFIGRRRRLTGDEDALIV